MCEQYGVYLRIIRKVWEETETYQRLTPAPAQSTNHCYSYLCHDLQVGNTEEKRALNFNFAGVVTAQMRSSTVTAALVAAEADPHAH